MTVPIHLGTPFTFGDRWLCSRLAPPPFPPGGVTWGDSFSMDSPLRLCRGSPDMRTPLGGVGAPPLLHFCRGSRYGVTVLGNFAPPPPFSQDPFSKGEPRHVAMTARGAVGPSLPPCRSLPQWDAGLLNVDRCRNAICPQFLPPLLRFKARSFIVYWFGSVGGLRDVGHWSVGCGMW